jgi:hypothetical protein
MVIDPLLTVLKPPPMPREGGTGVQRIQAQQQAADGMSAACCTIETSGGQVEKRWSITSRMAIALVMAWTVAGWAGPTTTLPATVKIDLTTPEDAARSFVTALNRMDIDSAVKTVANTPASRELITMTIEVSKARQALREALFQTFQSKDLHGTAKVLMEYQLQSFKPETSQRKDEAGRTLFYLNGSKVAPLILVKDGNEWRVDFEHCLLFEAREDADPEKYRVDNVFLRDEFQRLADDVRAGKFKTVDDFNHVARPWVGNLQQRMKEAEEKAGVKTN